MLIQTKNLNLKYKDGFRNTHAVVDVNINLPETGLFGIIGPSGSGKTSLLYLICGIRNPDPGGSILFAGQPLPNNKTERSQWRRENVGFVFQHHFLIPYLSAIENTIIGASHFEDANEGRARMWFDRMGLGGLENEKVYRLSGGQKQRLTIIRAMMNQPKLILVDEPTSNLDREAAGQVINIIEQLSKQVCVVVVTHNKNDISNAQHIFNMQNGRVVN